jgi:integrase
MRRGEVDKMRWDWLATVNGQPIVRVDKECAKSKRLRDIPIDPLIVAELESWRAQRADADPYVLPTPRRQRTVARRIRCEGVFKRVNAWMRSLGWKGQHTLHALRAEYLRRVRDGFGLNMAQAVAGHADARTTERSYTGQPQVRDGVVIPFDQLASRATR